MTKINVGGISFDADGRAVLSDEVLSRIEASYVPAAAAGTTNTAVCDGINSGCTNTTDCRSSTNYQTCTNQAQCARSRTPGPLA
jgi:hypothetical protein